MQVKKQKNWTWNSGTGSKLGKEYTEAVYCHPAYLTLYADYIMRNADLDKAQAGIKIARRNINNLRYTDGQSPCVLLGASRDSSPVLTWILRYF